GAADPEVAFARLAHLDHPLFHDARAHHDAMDDPAALRGQEFVAGFDARRGGTILDRHGVFLRHARLSGVGIMTRRRAGSDVLVIAEISAEMKRSCSASRGVYPRGRSPS